MISANELRIGNWYSNGQGIYNLSTSDFMDFLNEAQVHDGKVANIDPIPLTPEVLEKTGFTLNGFKQYEINLPKKFNTSTQKLYFSSDYLYLEEWDLSSRNRDIITLWNKDVMKVFYLHHLQNVYFSLTGEELTVNL